MATYGSKGGVMGRPRKGAPKKPAREEPRGRRCGICRNFGHNAQTCALIDVRAQGKVGR